MRALACASGSLVSARQLIRPRLRTQLPGLRRSGGWWPAAVACAAEPQRAVASCHPALGGRISTLGQSLSLCRRGGVKRSATSIAAATNGADTADSDLWLLVGLGNPGAQYEDNRHNVGFHAIDRLGCDAGIAVDKKQHNALVGRGQIWDRRVLLAKPTTFMNSSGKAVRKLMDYYKVPQDQVIVIYDDLDLPAGKVRLRPKGGHGGHNGMRSIVAQLGNSQDFARIRVGIGRPAGQMAIADWVLQDFTKAERQEMEFAQQEVLDTARAVLVEGMNRAISGVRV